MHWKKNQCIQAQGGCVFAFEPVFMATNELTYTSVGGLGELRLCIRM